MPINNYNFTIPVVTRARHTRISSEYNQCSVLDYAKTAAIRREFIQFIQEGAIDLDVDISGVRPLTKSLQAIVDAIRNQNLMFASKRAALIKTIIDTYKKFDVKENEIQHWNHLPVDELIPFDKNKDLEFAYVAMVIQQNSGIYEKMRAQFPVNHPMQSFITINKSLMYVHMQLRQYLTNYLPYAAVTLVKMMSAMTTAKKMLADNPGLADKFSVADRLFINFAGGECEDIHDLYAAAEAGSRDAVLFAGLHYCMNHNKMSLRNKVLVCDFLKLWKSFRFPELSENETRFQQAIIKINARDPRDRDYATALHMLETVRDHLPSDPRLVSAALTERSLALFAILELPAEKRPMRDAAVVAKIGECELEIQKDPSFQVNTRFDNLYSAMQKVDAPDLKNRLSNVLLEVYTMGNEGEQRAMLESLTKLVCLSDSVLEDHVYLENMMELASQFYRNYRNTDNWEIVFNLLKTSMTALRTKPQLTAANFNAQVELMDISMQAPAILPEQTTIELIEVIKNVFDAVATGQVATGSLNTRQYYLQKLAALAPTQDLQRHLQQLALAAEYNSGSSSQPVPSAPELEDAETEHAMIEGYARPLDHGGPVIESEEGQPNPALNHDEPSLDAASIALIRELFLADDAADSKTQDAPVEVQSVDIQALTPVIQATAPVVVQDLAPVIHQQLAVEEDKENLPGVLVESVSVVNERAPESHSRYGALDSGLHTFSCVYDDLPEQKCHADESDDFAAEAVDNVTPVTLACAADQFSQALFMGNSATSYAEILAALRFNAAIIRAAKDIIVASPPAPSQSIAADLQRREKKANKALKTLSFYQSSRVTLPADRTESSKTSKRSR